MILEIHLQLSKLFLHGLQVNFHKYLFIAGLNIVDFKINMPS